MLGGGQDKPAWTACPPGVKITRVGARHPGTACPSGGEGGGKLSRGGGGKINCYSTSGNKDGGQCRFEIHIQTMI